MKHYEDIDTNNQQSVFFKTAARKLNLPIKEVKRVYDNFANHLMEAILSGDSETAEGYLDELREYHRYKGLHGLTERYSDDYRASCEVMDGTMIQEFMGAIAGVCDGRKIPYRGDGMPEDVREWVE